MFSLIPRHAPREISPSGLRSVSPPYIGAVAPAFALRLGVDWVARTIPLAKDERDAMEAATGIRSIPTLVDGDTVTHGADAIIAYLDERYPEPKDARRHRAQMRAEWPLWVELEGR